MDNHTEEQNQPTNGEEKDWEALASEYLDGWKRERAAFDNYRKEEVERFGYAHSRTLRNFLAKLLPIFDNFELAATHTPEEAKKSDWFLGYTYIKKQFEDFLIAEGVNVIETEGKEFDPRFHEAIASEGDKDGEGILVIAQELRRGYKMGDFVIRPARVRVKLEIKN